MKLFEDEFKGATVKQWTPQMETVQATVPKSQQNIQTIMDFLDKVSQKAQNVSQADIVKETGLAKALVSRALNAPAFNILLNNKGYKKKIGGPGKPTIIHL